MTTTGRIFALEGESSFKTKYFKKLCCFRSTVLVYFKSRTEATLDIVLSLILKESRHKACRSLSGIHKGENTETLGHLVLPFYFKHICMVITPIAD